MNEGANPSDATSCGIAEAAAAAADGCVWWVWLMLASGKIWVAAEVGEEQTQKW